MTPSLDRSDDDHHDDVIQAEVAMELINRARALIYERIYRLGAGDATDQLAARGLRMVAVRLYQLLRTIDYREPARVAALVKRWSLLMRDEQQFWTVLREDPGLITF